MGLRPLPASLCVSLGLLVVVSDASAMTCWKEPPLLVLPAADVPAPRNTHVRVRLNRGLQGEGDQQIVCTTALCDAPGFGFAIRPAGRPTEAIAFRVTKAEAGETTTFDLAPNAPLPAGARFELWRTDANGADLQLLAPFVTGDFLDERPPTFPPLEGVAFHPYPPRPPSPGKKGGRKVFIIDLLEQSQPWIGFRGPAPGDEGTRRNDLAYFVWSVPAGASIDYTRTPDAMLSTPAFLQTGMAADHLFDWGAEGACFLTTLSTPYPKGKRKLGVRVVDLAGNRSEAQEREVDFGK